MADDSEEYSEQCTEKCNKDRRSICERCSRPASVCLCEFLPAEKVSLSTNIFILQHPAERNSSRTTVHIIDKCIRPCCIISGHYFRDRDSLPESLMDAITRGRDCDAAYARTLLLWPVEDNTSSHSLIDLNGDIVPSSCFTLRPSGHEANQKSSGIGPADIPLTLVLLDGTWPACRQMLERSPPLQGIQRARVIPSETVRVRSRDPIQL